MQVINLTSNIQPREMKSGGTQVTSEEIDLKVSVVDIKSKIKANMLDEEIIELVNREWPEPAFTYVTDNRNVTEDGIEGTVAVLAPAGKIPEIKFLRTLVGNSKKCMGQIKAGKLKQGDMLLNQTYGSTEIGEDLVEEERRRYIIGLADKEENEEQIKSIYKMCSKLREETEADDEVLHLAILSPVSFIIQRKIVECAFNEYMGEIVMHHKEEGRKTAAARKKPKFNTDAVIIEDKTRTYAEMVSALKNKLKEESRLKEDIKGIRQTREGHLLIEIKENSKETETIYKKIKEDQQNAVVRRLANSNQKTILNIYGLDIDTDESGVKNALAAAINTDVNTVSIQVKALRPLEGGRKAATIIVDPSIGSKIIELGKIKIGLSIANIKERKPVIKCNRCWKEGHRAIDCVSADLSKRCRNCTREGHMVKDCSAPPFCYTCRKEGHRTHSRECSRAGLQTRNV